MDNDEKLYDTGSSDEKKTSTPSELEARLNEGIISKKAAGVENIEISSIPGPLVIFYGPRNIGKTVSLLRLTRYLDIKYDVTPVSHFRKDNEYKETINTFNEIRNNEQIAPDATGNINFLLLDISRRNSLFCQILEAPGEHFFDNQNPTKQYPNYLNRIFSASYKKIFVFFFEVGMSTEIDTVQYSQKIVNLIRQNIDSKKDRVIILYNKSDEQKQYFVNGKPNKKEFRKDFNMHFRNIQNVLTENGFRKVHFVPFSSGWFTKNREDEEMTTYAPSSDHYPELFWNALYDCIVGGKGCLTWFLNR